MPCSLHVYLSPDLRLLQSVFYNYSWTYSRPDHLHQLLWSWRQLVGLDRDKNVITIRPPQSRARRSSAVPFHCCAWQDCGTLLSLMADSVAAHLDDCASSHLLT